MRIDLAGWSREATRCDHQTFLSLFERADDLGFAGVWFNEFRLQDPPLPYPSTLLLAAAVFARTSRLRVGLSILVLPLHTPLLLAEDLAQLDFQSGGRLDIGVGRGTTPDTFTRLGIAPSDIRPRFEAAFQVMRDAWADGVATTQRPHPPLYVAGTSAETLGFALKHDLPLLLSLEPPEGRQLDIYELLRAETGRVSSLRHSSLSRYVVMAPTHADALAKAHALLDRLHARRIDFAVARGEHPDSVIRRDPDRALAQQFIWGTPDDCVAQINALETSLGIGQVRCVFNGNGKIGNDEALADMTAFARHVLPYVRDQGDTHDR